MCPILIFTFCRRVSYLGRSCPVELLRLEKRFLTCIFHFKKMSFVPNILNHISSYVSYL